MGISAYYHQVFYVTINPIIRRFTLLISKTKVQTWIVRKMLGYPKRWVAETYYKNDTWTNSEHHQTRYEANQVIINNITKS